MENSIANLTIFAMKEKVFTAKSDRIILVRITDALNIYLEGPLASVTLFSFGGQWALREALSNSRKTLST